MFPSTDLERYGSAVKFHSPLDMKYFIDEEVEEQSSNFELTEPSD